MTNEAVETDGLVIGAGPGGVTAAALLRKDGLDLTILEGASFSRFIIDERLLPQCMELLEEAGLLPRVQSRCYQRKDGAAFLYGSRTEVLDFAEQYTPGCPFTYHIRRADFDQVLADTAAGMGVGVRFQRTVTDIELPAPSGDSTSLGVDR